LRLFTKACLSFALLALSLTLMKGFQPLPGLAATGQTPMRTVLEVDENGSFTRTTMTNGSGSMFVNQSTGEVTL